MGEIASAHLRLRGTVPTPKSILLALCAAISLCSFADAQSSATGTISGQVVDAGNAAIIGADLNARATGNTTDIHLVSDAQGHFFLSNILPGLYEIRVAHDGFRNSTETIQVTAGATVSLHVSLAVLSLAQSVTVRAKSPLMTEEPTGQTQSEVSREDFKNSPAITVAQVLDLIPGVTFIQGNGPRDVVISIRGSNERQTFGIRNVQVFEDGFPVTQPDGLARTDLTDPHAYSSVDVIQGPSSALYGNYATGGAINFHTRTGSDIHGLETGTDFGSFGYFNDFATYGAAGDHSQISVFLSNVRANQATAFANFNTLTGNVLATLAATPRDRFTLKFIDNELDANLSIRLSLAQYRLNPLQQGCKLYSSVASAQGCASISVFTNGYNGVKESLTAEQAGLGRHDRRTIVGARWEHDLTQNTLFRTQFVFDNRDANQPTSSTGYRGTLPSFNITGDLLRTGSLHGHHATSYAAAFLNDENINSQSTNLAPGGNATLGGATQTVIGSHRNTGGRVRQEIALGERWTLVAGIGIEYTGLHALANNFTYPSGAAPVIVPVVADRMFFNVAPEVSALYRAGAGLQLHARLGTGYGTPQATQLFTNSKGNFGNNVFLQTQRNTGVDIGAEWTLPLNLQATITGFYEWFRNEQVTQSPGVNLQSFTFNAPASAHRGIEAAVDWHPFAERLTGLRLRGSYLYDNQIYTDYTEQLTTGAVSASFSRKGLFLPGVQPNFLNGRLIYDQPTGVLRGFGGFVEVNWRDNYKLDNANLLGAPGTTLIGVSAHYDPPPGHRALSRLRFYFDVENIVNKSYVASAGNLTDTLNATTGMQNGAGVLVNATGSIYAGTPRASYGGVRMRF